MWLPDDRLERSHFSFGTLVAGHAPDCLVIAGRNGSLTDELDEFIDQLGLSGHVALLGYREDIPDLLEAANVVVSPSDRGGGRCVARGHGGRAGRAGRKGPFAGSTTGRRSPGNHRQWFTVEHSAAALIEMNSTVLEKSCQCFRRDTTTRCCTIAPGAGSATGG